MKNTLSLMAVALVSSLSFASYHAAPYQGSQFEQGQFEQTAPEQGQFEQVAPEQGQFEQEQQMSDAHQWRCIATPRFGRHAQFTARGKNYRNVYFRALDRCQSNHRACSIRCQRR